MNDAPTQKWREDFPIEWVKDHYTTRREFTKFLVLTSGALFAGNGFFVVKRLGQEHRVYPRMDVAGTDELEIGAVKLFRYPTDNDPAILIRLDEQNFVAYKQRCTHLSCPVYYAHERSRMECPCHNGGFDAATGRVLYGPPPRALPRIALAVQDGRIFAEGLAPEEGEKFG